MSSETNPAWRVEAINLVPGEGQGPPLILEEPLSLWGGLDPHNGRIIDQRHPQAGETVTGRVMILPSGRGSSSASSILLEAIHAGTGPAAIITAEADGILALGAVVAREIYGQTPPVVVVPRPQYDELVQRLSPQTIVSIADQLVSITGMPSE